MALPILGLLMLAAVPAAACWRPRLAAVLAAAFTVGALVRGEGLERVALALGEATALGAVLAGLARRTGPALPTLLALALFLLPWWLPPACERLAGPNAPLPGAAWSLWPGALLAGPDWDPLREGPLYATWGSRTETGAPLPALHLLLLVLLAALLYCRPGASRVRPRPPGQGP
ncbi:MAG: hypothetical protein D6702_04365 [Planctomycetota bacterium]|nr:MAG: hypothetical protein D6702_04365 [Planctomycetota bacterium]